MSNIEKTSVHDTSYFAGMNELAGKVADQNNRYEELATDPHFEDLEDMRQVAVDNLWLEQSFTVDELANADQAPYTELAMQHMAVERELQEVQERYDAITDQEDARINRVRLAAQRAIELSPLSETQMQELASQKIEALHDLNREELAQRIGELSTQLAGLNDVYAVAGGAWELPRVPSGVVEDANDIIDDAAEYVDVLPIDLENRDHEGSSFTRFVEAYNAKASETTKAFLLATMGAVITDKDIAAVTYADVRDFKEKTAAEIDERNEKAANSLMRRNGYLAKILAEDGLAIQYGERILVHPGTMTRVKGSRKTRIYRIIEHEMLETADDLIERVDYVDLPETETVDAADIEVTTEPTNEVLVSKELMEWLHETGLVATDGKKVPAIRIKHTLMLSGSKESTPVDLADNRNYLRAAFANIPPQALYTADQIIAVAAGALGDPELEAKVALEVEDYYASLESSQEKSA